MVSFSRQECLVQMALESVWETRVKTSELNLIKEVQRESYKFQFRVEDELRFERRKV